MSESLTADKLRELLSNAPATGVFRWRVSHGRVCAGDVAGRIGSGYRVTWFHAHAAEYGLRFPMSELAYSE
jgi:hypothetical protein